ncbi:helix-turn-helix domain-containing protein, partial [Bifidobacterium longum]|uniref:helix-turn-helix domain-containing protein n=1 Tax=Bifidobacterium longum TaxID=216816 RepID=UPI0035674916
MGQQYSHLSSEERILIEKLHCEQHLSIRRTAERIGRDKSTVSRELRRGLWFASNENGSYRPYRPKRLKTGPWTSGPFYSALAAQRCISSSRCFVLGVVPFSWTVIRGGDGHGEVHEGTAA